MYSDQFLIGVNRGLLLSISILTLISTSLVIFYFLKNYFKNK